MAEQESVDTERTVVTTYVPAYQKQVWADHAAELGMSQSEFVRTMVQAGRRGFGAKSDESEGIEWDQVGPSPGRSDPNAEDTRSQGSNPGGNVRETVLQTLEEHGPLSWDGLAEHVIGDIEADLEEVVMDLVESSRITHHPRAGEYALAED